MKVVAWGIGALGVVAGGALVLLMLANAAEWEAMWAGLLGIVVGLLVALGGIAIARGLLRGDEWARATAWMFGLLVGSVAFAGLLVLLLSS
ncbi:hypothetical protein ON058_00310 [Demequina sp. B12]|uniref:hypothetical protein n=1 Tax=Demequina sp. B12 TaxID=2992757 RepID=UPI00237BFDB2|nr:hypothetical protein [Demequina sp. B12]MDE0571857.1 hypothetical protein [Demequina sp. B12]